MDLPSSTGELVFGVARIFASFNDTFVHVTDLRYVHLKRQDLERPRLQNATFTTHAKLTTHTIVAAKPSAESRAA